MTKLQHLKALCERAEQGNTFVFGDVKGFWIQSSDVLKLLSIIETQGKALERIAKNGGPNAGMGYTNAQCAHEALTAVEKILGE